MISNHFHSRIPIRIPSNNNSVIHLSLTETRFGKLNSSKSKFYDMIRRGGGNFFTDSEDGSANTSECDSEG